MIELSKIEYDELVELSPLDFTAENKEQDNAFLKEKFRDWPRIVGYIQSHKTTFEKRFDEDDEYPFFLFLFEDRKTFDRYWIHIITTVAEQIILGMEPFSYRNPHQDRLELGTTKVARRNK